MGDPDDLKPTLRQRASELLRPLAAAEREALLVKCWMAHDARWFMAAVAECGIAVTNRLNRAASYEIGKVEAQRIVRLLRLPPVATLDDYLLAQEVFIGLLGPDLLDYRVLKLGDDACAIHVRRCFAHENVVRAGVADRYECGIFPRIAGWLDALCLSYRLSPSLGPCLKVQGPECRYEIALTGKAPSSHEVDAAAASGPITPTPS